MQRTITLFFLLLTLSLGAQAQATYWQQEAKYTMDIDFDVKNHQFTGTQRLEYTNNSPDTLRRVFYHLYFNAFQPGSMMDVRSRTIRDPDRRVRDRIFALKDNEIGYLNVESLKQDKKKVQFDQVGTILEVTLNEPILPGKSARFDMEFEGQVPVQIRRSGRDNAEGVDYSMSQWYPKMSEYDIEGWHANPYVGREFHGIWSDFDVTIRIDKDYTVASTGYLQNPEEIGHGYEDEGMTVKQKVKDGKLIWQFKAPKVHDFMWAADSEYKHDRFSVNDDLELHFFYLPDVDQQDWERLQPKTAELFRIMNENFGQYPYKKYSVVQGGDGGMEYPMGTLITGKRSFNSLLGVTIHEVIHSWYQMVLATNEAKYAWMDEGFTSYAQDYVSDVMSNAEAPGTGALGSYRAYFAIAKSGDEEPLTTHADHFKTNRAYSIASYVKGAMVPSQLSYVLGQETMMQGMRNYYRTWKFKHPTPRAYKRVMEKTSGLELDWFFEHWIGTINQIDYGIGDIIADGQRTTVQLERLAPMPMPTELVVTYKDGSEELYYIPLRIMRGAKSFEEKEGREVIQLADWPWTYPTYAVSIPRPLSAIERIEIDPSERMADIERDNNTYPNTEGTQFVDQK